MAAFSQAQTLAVGTQPQERGQASLWVSAREAFWIALDTLRSHKLRTFLTLLGVVIATTTLIVVMSVINGMNLYVANKIANLGANTLVLSQFKWTSTDEEWLKAQRRNKPIRLDDYVFLKDHLQGYKTIAAEAGVWPPPEVKYKGRSLEQAQVGGVTPSMIDVGNEKVGFGRFINDTDYEHESMVCFIGTDLVDQFFPMTDPLDKTLMIGGKAFRVIGVAEKLGTIFGQSQDAFVQIPLTTLGKAFVARPRLNVDIQGFDNASMIVLGGEVTALMRARHHLPYKEDDDFGVNSSQALMSVWTDLTGSIFAVAIAIVAVFMVVGGIVIMNIMLASVTERTHEIGVRKSLGARRRDILTQFLIESAVMSVVGGLIGVLLAVLIAQIVAAVFTAEVPLSAVLVGLTLSTAVGLFFGIYPASRASKLSPIEALRTEN
ncbi:MAG TPA: ABC transporter permease [Terriglobia bacterium]|nr:ABC transporter permease [Terriglobia bacterium]